MARAAGGRALNAEQRSPGTRWRDLALSAVLAFWGLGIAISLVSVWSRPAPPGQTPGLATALNLDAAAPFRWVAGMMLLPILAPLLFRPLIRHITSGRLWATVCVGVAGVVAFWLTTLHRDPLWTIAPVLFALVLCALLRSHAAEFSRRDAVLLPTILATWLATYDVTRVGPEKALILAASLVFLLRLAVTAIPSPLAPALSFLLAPLGLLLQTGFFGRNERYFGWHVLAIVLLTPFLLRFTLRDPRRATAILLFVVHPLALYGYTNAMSMGTAEGRPRVNFFEDGHPLLPASEYLRGERPYRDILPAHGLIEDGGFDYAAMKLGGASVGTTAKARAVAGNLNSVALYALAFAATGSAEAALFAVMLSVLLGSYTMNIRLLAALVALAFIAAAVRRRRPRLFAYAAFATVVSGATSLDFGAYTFLALVVAVLRFHPDRPAALRSAAIGTAAGVVPLFGAFAIFGILDDFFYGTFVETLSAGSAYTMTIFVAPPAMENARAFPDVLVALLDRQVFPFLFWCAIAVFVGATVTRRARRSLEPLVILGVWIVASAISYAERLHLYFVIITGVVVVFTIFRLLRRHPALAFALIVAAMAMAAPTTHLSVVGWMRGSRGPIEPEWVQIAGLPRARGAYFHTSDAAVVESVRKYISLSLERDETFFDFTNQGILYFLTGRDCPIRYYEVAFYQSEERQREVIRQLENNPRVKAALVPAAPNARFAVDGIPNAVRAPLVWQYLETHFTPDFAEGDVVFWRRHPPARPAS